MTKLDKKQLLETIRDTIYEVLEEELDRRITETEEKKEKQLKENKANAVKARKERKALQEKKEALKVQYKKLLEQEEELSEKWGKDVKVHRTGEFEDRTVESLKKELEGLKNKEEKTEADKKREHQLVFAIRAKGHWKKGKGATK